MVFITSIINSSFRPALMPIASTSVLATMMAVASRLLLIFIAWPMPGPPQRKASVPMHLSTGIACSMSAGSPPTIKVSVPLAACSLVLPTGESTIAMPSAFSALPTRCEVTGSMVLMSITRPPRCMPAAMPSAPSATCSTCCGSGSIVTTISLAAPTSFGLAAAFAPAATRRATASGLRSYTVSAWPPFSTLSAIGPPITPSPMNPTLMSMLRFSKKRQALSAHLSISHSGRPRRSLVSVRVNSAAAGLEPSRS